MTTLTVSRASDLGPALRAVREQEGLTQAVLARAAGVGRQWLVDFEGGRKPNASVDLCARVAFALGVSVLLEAPQPPAAGEVDDVNVDLDALLDG